MHSIRGIEEKRKIDEIGKFLFLASDIWFKEGYPKYWNLSNVKELGLANNGEVNFTKLYLLQQMGYSRFSSLMNLGNYRVYYRVYNETNATLFEFPENGRPLNPKILVKIKRFLVFNSTPAILDVILWEEE